ncbi:MAG: DDE-type integrase/transposase/recombinase [Bacteroidota bacterium]
MLRGIEITRPNQIWWMDIFYIPAGRGYMYRVAIINLYCRCIVGWSLSNTMTSEWYRACVEAAMNLYGNLRYSIQTGAASLPV